MLIHIISGPLWYDDASDVINAHGGGMMQNDGTYYWYGEYRGCDGRRLGVTCYTSTDLHKWSNRGLVLKTTSGAGELEQGCIIERPKVVYNAKTRKYVLWFHHELKGKGYGSAHAAVAISDNPLGPFRLIRSSRVNAGINPVGMEVLAEYDASLKPWTPEWTDAVKKGMITDRDKMGGQMSRDMTIFVDDDGKAYHIYSSEENLTLQIAELTDDYADYTGKYVRVAPCGHNEAPAIFKRDGIYWMITSGCTGWAPNAARLFRANNIFGPWQQLPNPCVGADSLTTFHAQGTYILPIANGQYIFMADRWNPNQLHDSRYIWLPIKFGIDGIPSIEWASDWSF